MKHLKNFKIFEKELTYIKKNIEIRFDVEASPHAMDRKYRHGIEKEELIEEGDVIDLVERSIEELTIALMQNRLNVDERFVLKDKDSGLCAVCLIQPGDIDFNLTVITVMRNQNFRTGEDQFVLEI
jgi:hypothetical protein